MLINLDLRHLYVSMVELPPNWEELSSRDYIDDEPHGRFVDAWGKVGDDGMYEKIVAVHNRKVKRYQPKVYVFDEVDYQKTRLQKLAEKIKSGESVGKPVLDRNRKCIGTANTPDEAMELAFSQIGS